MDNDDLIQYKVYMVASNQRPLSFECDAFSASQAEKLALSRYEGCSIVDIKVLN